MRPMWEGATYGARRVAPLPHAAGEKAGGEKEGGKMKLKTKANWLVILAFIRISASVGMFCVLMYCIFSGLWLPAIFFLLARREVVRAVDTRIDQLSESVEAEIGATAAPK